MKLTQRQLRRIIKEELTQGPKKARNVRAGRERPYVVSRPNKSSSDPVSQLIDALEKANDILLGAQELTETVPELKQYQRLVSSTENRISVAKRTIEDDADGSW